MRLLQHVALKAVFVLAFDLTRKLIFSRCYRLSRREGFSRILQKKPSSNTWFAVHTQANTLDHARLGVSVSKRNVPSAVQRNKIKRLVRESFRIHAVKIASYDFVVRLRKSFEIKDCDQARKSLNETLNLAVAPAKK